MKITELLDLKGIELNVSVSSKDEAINKLIDLMCATGKISDKDAYKEGILAREVIVLLLVLVRNCDSSCSGCSSKSTRISSYDCA